MGAKARRRQLPHYRRAQRQGAPFVVAAARVVTACRIVGEHQLPRQVRGLAVDHEHDAVELARGILKVVRHHQLKKHAAKIFVPDRVADLLRHERFDQPGLALLHHRFGARALADVQEAQPVGVERQAARGLNAGRAHAGSALVFAAVGIGDDQARPIARVAIVEQALARALAAHQLAAGHERRALFLGLRGEPLGQLAQRIHRGDRGVDIELDDVEPGNADVQPRGLEEARVGLHHAAHQRLD